MCHPFQIMIQIMNSPFAIVIVYQKGRVFVFVSSQRHVTRENIQLLSASKERVATTVA